MNIDYEKLNDFLATVECAEDEWHYFCLNFKKNKNNIDMLSIVCAPATAENIWEHKDGFDE